MALEVVLGAIGIEGARAALGARSAPVRANGLRALVVDDEPSICDVMTKALAEAGYTAVAAQSGESALATIRAEHIDIMLIDLRIPDMRGDIIFEVAAATQPHLAYQTVFMTGDITDNAMALIGACKCHFLRKPFDLTDLDCAIAAIAPRAREQTA